MCLPIMNYSYDRTRSAPVVMFYRYQFSKKIGQIIQRRSGCQRLQITISYPCSENGVPQDVCEKSAIIPAG